MTLTEQVKTLRDYAVEEFIKEGYLPCAIRHNKLIEWYKDKNESVTLSTTLNDE